MNSSRNRPLLGPPLERGVKKISGVPFFIKGTVIKGFGRGSKELGIPTANLDPQQFPQIIEQIPPGVYFGWSRLKFQDGVLSSIYKMAMNIGWNPFFKNEKKSVEIHIMHQFEEDFYGVELQAIVANFIRDEYDFKNNLSDLINGIKDDIAYAEDQLDLPEYLTLIKNFSSFYEN